MERKSLLVYTGGRVSHARPYRDRVSDAVFLATYSSNRLLTRRSRGRPASDSSFKLAYSGRSKLGVVGLRGFKLNPALLTYVMGTLPARRARRPRHRRERRVSKRLEAETIDRLVAEYVAGTPSAELGRRYGIAKSSVTRLVREAGKRVRHPRLSAAETAQLVTLYEAGLSQMEIAQRLGRSPSAVWHCLRRAGFVGARRF
jgi:DNA-directed RNA polymerase specialized sigma24 family protein